MSKPTLFQVGKLVGDGLADIVPIDYIIDWFRARMNRTGIENRVLVLKSETASGKSTVLPPVLYRANLSSNNAMIVTQPRVLTAISNVEEIRKHNKFTDQEIGHSTRYDKLRPSRSGLLSATIGTLTMQLQSSTDDEIARRYRYIMIDESHERNVDLDLTLALLKKLLTRLEDREDCPFLILASATFEPDEFLRYFGVPRATNFIWCGGAPHPIEEMWSYMGDHYAMKYVNNITDIVNNISQTDTAPRSDVLVFLPGANEMRTVAAELNKVNTGIAKKGGGVFLLLQIDRNSVNTDNRDNRLLKAPLESSQVNIAGRKIPPVRRVILSTVVAETGLTLPDLKYVIDVGFSREVEYLPDVGAVGLITKPAPRSRIWQRRGRAGRNAPGVFYPLYPRHLYDKLQKTQYPEIVTADCTNYIMSVVNTQLKETPNSDAFDPCAVDMITKPPSDSFCTALRTLHNIGFMHKMHITPLGRLAMKLNMPPQHARMILAAYYWGAPVTDCVRACCFVLSGIDASKMKWRRIYAAAGYAETPAGYSALRLSICDQFIDGAIFYRALERVAKDSLMDEFCAEVKADLDRVVTFVESVEETLSLMIQAEMRIGGELPYGADKSFMRAVSAMKHCIYDGFSGNLITLVEGARVYARATNPRVTGIAVPDILADTVETRAEAAASGISIRTLPKYIIAAQLNIAAAGAGYELRSSYISVLDGYLSPDLNYGY